MTTYYIRGKTIWINYYVDGKRLQKSTKLKNTPKNIKIVTTQIIPALDIKIATGEIYKKRPKTFEFYGGIFLKQKETNKSFWMKRNYYYRVIDYFRGQDIDKITRFDIKEYLILLNMKSKSKNEYKNCVKTIFELAVDDEVLKFNPALDIKLKADEKEPIQFYTKEEVNKLLSVATGVIKPYLLIAFNTGMRPGEILGLQLGDFKDDGYIHIKRTRSKGFIGNGKTSNAIRKVPYPSYIFDEVKKIQTNNIFIFGDIDDASLLRAQWRDVNTAAKLTKHKAGLLGHSSPRVTLEHYASVIEAKSIDLGTNFSLFDSSSCYKSVTIENEKAPKALKQGS